ncbi:MAG: hypothetical protein VX341_11455 [Bdellovibrionota bacterium]|nr:hypothetical protein [Bdellovibrionota bacterium]
MVENPLREEASYSTVNYSHPLETIFTDISYEIKQPYFQIFTEGYEIRGNNSSEVYNAHRKRNWFRRSLAFMIGIFAFFATAGFIVYLGMVTFVGGAINAESIKSAQMTNDAQAIIPLLSFVGICLGVVSFVVVTKLLSPIRRTQLFKGEEKVGDPLITITPSSGMFFFNRTYYLLDSNGRKVVIFKRPFLESIFRKRWHAYDKDNNYLFTAIEDSLLLAILRRYLKLGKFIPLHFDLNKNGGKNFASFKKKFAIRDQYDLIHNPKAIASWIIIATAVLLDTGEER